MTAGGAAGIFRFCDPWRFCHMSPVERPRLASPDSRVYCVLARRLQPHIPQRPPLFVISPASWLPHRHKTAFTLIEMVAVIAVIVILMTAGVSLMGGSGSQARRTGADLLAGMVEQARTAAITSRCHVILAVAEPGDLPSGDQRCRLGLFKVEQWPENPSETIQAVLMSRWRPLESGAVLIGGRFDGIENPLDGAELTLAYGANKPLTVKVHALAFHPRGGLKFPEGSTPVVIRVAEGGYRSGKATAWQKAGSTAIAESKLKIGRVTARPFRID